MKIICSDRAAEVAAVSSKAEKERIVCRHIVEDKLTDIYKADSFHSQCCPRELASKIIGKISELTGKILVIYDVMLLWEVARHVYKSGSKLDEIYFICSNKMKGMFVKTLGIPEKNIMIVDQNKIGKWLKSLQGKEMSMKFDVIVGNPPYQQGLHMKFLDMSFDLLSETGELVFVHPATEFIKQGTGSTSKEVKKISKHIKCLELTNPSKFFPTAKLGVPISITHITNQTFKKFDLTVDNKTISLSNVNDISVHSLKCGFYSFKKHILSLKGNKMLSEIIFPVNNKYKTNKQFFIEMSLFTGNTGHGNTTLDSFFNYDFYCFISKNAVIKQKLELKAGNYNYAMGFSSKTEAENMFSFVKTKFARACLGIYKINLRLSPFHFKHIPIPPMNQSWDDKKLAKYFKLTEEEIAFVNSIPNYYDEDFK